MSGEVIDFEGLAMDADVHAACEFVRALVRRQLGIEGDEAAGVIAALDAMGGGAGALADVLGMAQAEPLDLTLWDLLYVAMSIGRLPVVSFTECPHPATNPGLLRAMRAASGGGAE